MSTTDTTSVSNRSEIIFLYDAEDCNPNGNPLSANNKPRIDETTGQAVVTDVRLKRYLRDQLDDDDNDEGIYVRNPSKAPYDNVPTRDELFQHVTGLDEDEVDEMDGGTVADAFLTNATDVRYFGATCSFSEDFQTALGEEFPGQFIGPVQFEHARSLHTVATKTESKQLSTVVASSEGDQQGTFASDNRLEYAFIRFHGIVNEVAAETTNLSATDVERLDSLTWRALKNQTLTRSKAGHHPRLYLRVEYSTDEYHNGRLDDGISLDETASKADTELRNITDAVLNVDELLTELADDAAHIETVYVKADRHIKVAVDGEVTGPDTLITELKAAVGEDAVTEIDVYGTSE